MAPSALTLGKTPPFLMAAGLLLWGWQCDFLPYAALMAVILEYSGFSRWRIPISDKEFNHISDLSGIMLLAVVIYLFSVNAYYGIYTILAVLPFIFFLLILAQVYSTTGKIKLAALFISLRRINPSTLHERNMEIDLSFPYLLICIISASAGNHHELQFYLLIVLLFAWTLGRLRPRHGSMVTWALLFALAATAGYGGQAGLRKFQGVIEETFLDWFSTFTWHNRDPMRNTTAIGSLGKLKLSDRIMVRVDTHGEKITGRILLREATYTDYGYGIWTNYRNTMQLVDPAADGKSWIINKTARGSKRYTISFQLQDDRGIIPVPHGINTITNIKATGIDANAYGAIILELHPGWFRYDTLFTDNALYDTGPRKEDLAVPPLYQKDLATLVRKLDLDGRTAEQALNVIQNFFADNFSYSLTQNERYPRGKYLTKFLFETRRGHCEYFATATVLLLRAAGIPARYALGYSIDEYSSLERQYIGRANHAHSWALAYINNAWRVIDTTPAIWTSVDAGNKSALEPFVDLWSWLTYALATWNSSDTDQAVPHMVTWIAILLLLYVVWRAFIKKRLQKTIGTWHGLHSFKPREAQSGIHALLPRLEQKYMPRNRAETLSAWVARIEDRHGAHGLRPILALHYRHRFDPRGLPEHEEARLVELVKSKLEEFSRDGG